jgi:hypothetical protein
MKVTYSNGHIKVTSGSEQHEIQWQDQTGALGALLHPQMFASSLALAAKALQADPSTKSTTLQVFFVDRGLAMPMKVTLLQPKSVEIAGKKYVTQHFSMEGAGTQIDFYIDEAGIIVGMDLPAAKERCFQTGWDAIFN